MSLQDLIDERDILRSLARFARIADGRKWDALGDVFPDDVTFDYGFGEREGIEALRAVFQQFLDPCGPSQHMIGSALVSIEGDRAVSRAYVQARHQGKDEKSDRFFDTNGEYVDQWERRLEGWRIVRREAIWATHKGDPSVLAP